MYNSQEYNAKIVDFSYEKIKNRKGYYITTKIPVFQFVTTQGDTITQRVLFSYSKKTYNTIGTIHKVRYNADTGNILIPDRTFYSWFSVILFFALFFGFVFLGLVLYALGRDMTAYKKAARIAFFYITIPVAICAFATVLLLAAFQKPDLELIFRIIAAFFGILLVLFLLMYVRLLFVKKENKGKNNRHSRPPFLEFRR